MRIGSEGAGFRLGEADILRRAMGKKKPEIIAGLRQQFIQGAAGRGVEPEIAGKIFDLMEYFAGYGFNKSHSAAYALLAYQTAYLKAYYPVEFMAALLTSVMDSADRVPFYVEECRQRKIQVLPPDVNESGESFHVSGNKIRFGLAAIKQVGYQAIEAIIAEREKNGPYTSLQDFCERVDLSCLNRRVLENLIKAGAFSSVPGTRAQLLEILHLCIEQGLAVQREKNSNQLSLFDFTSQKTAANPPIPLPPARDFSEQEILQMEKEVLGLYLSGHPLAQYQEVIKRRTSHLIEELGSQNEEEIVIVAGLITAIRRTVTKRGETMAYFILEDLTGRLETLVFPRVLSRVNDLLRTDAAVLVRGRFTMQEDKPKLILESMELLDEAAASAESGGEERLYLKITGFQGEKEAMTALLPIIEKYSGTTPLFLFFPNSRKLIQCASRYWVKATPELRRELEEILGPDSTSLVKK